MTKIPDPLAPGLRLLMKLARFVDSVSYIVFDPEIREWLRQMRSQKLI